MPELPEVEAWTRGLDPEVSRSPVEKAGPAHIATLKTFDPPLSALEGRRFAGARRRAKRLLFPTDDGELVLMVHLMSAGELRALEGGERRVERLQRRDVRRPRLLDRAPRHLRIEAASPRFDFG